MKLIIDISRADYSAFNKFHFVETRLKRTIILVVTVLLVLQMILNRDGFILVPTITSAMAFLLICFFAINRNLNRTKNIPDQDGAILGKKEVEFTQNKIIYKTSNSEGTYDWSTVRNIKESPDAFYIYMDANMAILIPKRIFKALSEEASFRSLICDKTGNRQAAS